MYMQNRSVKLALVNAFTYHDNEQHFFIINFAVFMNLG